MGIPRGYSLKGLLLQAGVKNSIPAPAQTLPSRKTIPNSSQKTYKTMNLFEFSL
jgi:hypothetical protein